MTDTTSQAALIENIAMPSKFRLSDASSATMERPTFMEAPHRTSGLPPSEESKVVDDSQDLLIGSPKVPERASTSGSSCSEQSSAVAASWNLRKHLHEKLYHREVEEELLLQNFERVVEDASSAALLLISGKSGSGKTALAKTLRQPVQEMGGYFVTGKFDQLRRPSPYTAFVSAFEEFTNLVLERGDDATESMRDAILNEVGEESAVLTKLMPSLERILGSADENEPDSKAKADDAIQRFVFVFRSFMRAVCSRENPVVFLLDDLHFADACSLDLLTSLITVSQNEGLVLVATCDDDVLPESYLSGKLREIEDWKPSSLSHIEVRNLKQDAVVDMVADALRLDVSSSEPLSKIVLCQTEGNPAHVIEFLLWLLESDLLHYDHATGRWEFDSEEIEMTIDTRKVGDFLADKLEQLPKDVKEVLKVSACLGSHIDEHLLEYVLGVPVESALKVAAFRGVIIPDEARGGYVFDHDGVQAAAYGLILEDDRELFHLEVGRRMWRRLDKEELDTHLFTLLSQMRIGKRLINRDKERVAVASLCLHAGAKAAKASTFRMAWIYFDFGVSLLEKRSWREQYNLTLALHNAAAEMAMCTAKFERMDELVDVILANARTLLEKIPAYATRIYGLSVSDRQPEAVDCGVEVLKGLGERFPNRLCTAHLMSEVKRVRKLLRNKSDEQLLRTPTITNKEKLACLQILHMTFFSALMARPKLSAYIVLKMMKLTMKHGTSVFTSAAFANYGMICIGHGCVEGGYRYGELSLRFLDRFEAKVYLPRVYLVFYGLIYGWKKPIRDTLEPLMKAHKIGLQTGDMEGAFLCANVYCMNAFECGVPLHVIEKEWRDLQATMISNRHRTLFKAFVPKLQLIHHHMGLTDDPLGLKGDLMDYGALVEAATESEQQMKTLSVNVSRLTLAYVFNDYDLAEELATATFNHLWKAPSSFKKVVMFFYGGLVNLACAREGRDVRRNLRSASRVIREFERYSTLTPHNCLDKQLLLEAELASVTKQNALAYKKYTCALAMAKDSGFTFMIALINERCARHHVAIGDKAGAKPFFEQACHYYKEWGGVAKLERLEAEVVAIYDSSCRLSLHGSRPPPSRGESSRS